MATHKVSVKYSKPGTQPPIFLAGSFSEWEPQEMDYTTDESNEHIFYKEVDVEHGKEYQYKFRIGLGEWWTLNEDSPTVTDDLGNKNNLLAVPKIENTTADSENSQTAEHPHTEAPSSADAVMEKEKTPSIEETIGTRETDDTLFADEIVKDTDREQPAHLSPATKGSIEPHSTPAMLEKLDNEPVEGTNHIKELQDIRGSDALSPDLIEPTPTPLVDINHLQDLDATNSGNVSDNESEDGKAVAPPTFVVEAAETTAPSDKIELDEPAHDDSTLLKTSDIPQDTPSRLGALTPDLANVAAEVADTAATLDPEEPTPPVSDDEAGRIGYRRMSATPIPEVALTAAEVADSAAILDKQEDEDEPIEPIRPFDIDDGELPATPPNEKVPRFSHECPSPPSGVIEPCTHDPIDPYAGMLPRVEKGGEIDLNDPSIQPFPTDRAGIMEHLRKLQERLPEDEVKLDLAPASPVVGPNARQVKLQQPEVSPIVLPQRSPSLQPIAELASEEEANADSTTLKFNGEEDQFTNGAIVNAEEINTVDDHNLPQEEPKTSVGSREKPEDPPESTDDAKGSSPQNEAQLPSLELQDEVEELSELAVDAKTSPPETEVQLPSLVPQEETKEVSESVAVNTNGHQSAPEESEPALKQQGETEEISESIAGDAKHLPKSHEKVQLPSLEAQEETEELPEPEIPSNNETSRQQTADPSTTEMIEQSSNESEAKTVNESTEESTTQVELSDGPSAELTDGVCEEDSHTVPTPHTPLIVGDRQLGHEFEDVRELSSGTTGPTIILQPASPFPGIERRLGYYDNEAETTTVNQKPLDKSNVPDVIPKAKVSPDTPGSTNTGSDTTVKHTEMGKSTAVDENDDARVKSRKRLPSPARSIERPKTPTSIHSSKDATGVRDRNIFKAFFRMIFVEWIGGFFRRLCRGRRGVQILIVGALILTILAPALYYFDMVPPFLGTSL